MFYETGAQVYITLEMFQEALESCEKAIEIDPHNTKGYLKKATALIKTRGDLQSLKLICETIACVIKYEPDNVEALKMLAEQESLYKHALKQHEDYIRSLALFTSEGGEANSIKVSHKKGGNLIIKASG